ncbi:MAG: amidohydrolase [Candidatus Fermentibacteraceae bacterium]|nr:amidohydrolase [Candidatus Fermentibacteraceae bacterium]MBN2608567.1 amidohydrolase [Candidatus Fermentibacteraceae bacterium]
MEVSIGSEEKTLRTIRHLLHSEPELSGGEEATASRVAEILSSYAPAKLLTNLGGHGVAAEFEGSSPGPRILLRCDMDALPINESATLPHASTRRGVSHKCGHDGHMAIMLGVAGRLSRRPPASGSAVLLFQPEEETGLGARKILDDPAFGEISPSMAFAVHNLPGFPLGSVILAGGPFASASRGMAVYLRGESSHASEPQLGRSPAMAAAHLIQAFTDLPQTAVAMDRGAKATVIHVRIGEEAYGTSPGEGKVLVTLRAHDQETLSILAGKAGELAGDIARAYGLDPRISWTQEFPSTVNDPGAVSIVNLCAQRLGMELIIRTEPFPWSEDFGHFTGICPGALFGLGSGEDHPALHSPEYDFPDELIAPGAALFMEILEETLG